MNGTPKRDRGKTWVHFACGFVMGALCGFFPDGDWLAALITAVAVGTLAAVFLDGFWERIRGWWW